MCSGDGALPDGDTRSAACCIRAASAPVSSPDSRKRPGAMTFQQAVELPDQ